MSKTIPVKVPPELADNALEKNGKKYLLITTAIFVEVEASETAGSPVVTNGKVSFHDTPNDPKVNHAHVPTLLGVMDGANYVQMFPFLPMGGTYEAKCRHMQSLLDTEWARITE